ncbi:MAG TPA: glutamate synthase large subunit [Sphingomicrobium sp.]|nr:glutamate synthase large subunit [Sphingomicrobium sp.]
MEQLVRGGRREGLYDPQGEHDSCGMGFIAHIKGAPSHEIIARGLQILASLDHRGGVGADPTIGDGAGCLIQLPDSLLRSWAAGQRINLPPSGDYAVAMCFLPRDSQSRSEAEARLERFVRLEGQLFLGWRDVPVNLAGLGAGVTASAPVIRQAIVGRGNGVRDQDAFERKLLAIRKQTQNPLEQLAREKQLPQLADFYIPSFSSRTIVYKGLLLPHQLGSFYEDLANPLTASALAMVHQRFSTNTFPSWRLAHPYRFISHNGEINTVRGNVNWMNARRRTLESALIGPDLDKMWPIIPHGQSDTACLDNALELLIAGGYSLPHAMMLLIPEAWAGDPRMDPERRAFYEFHAALMEPWDGPAAIAFTDGRQIGATLDRNGLRPARFCVTDEDLVVMASEAGVLPIPEERIVRKWRLQPGKMLLIDLEQGRIIDDDEVKAELAQAEPYGDWLGDTQFNLKDLPVAAEPKRTDPAELPVLQQAFGYSQEDLKVFLAPMAAAAEDPVGSMGSDTPLAVLSQRPRLLYDYFKQNFAQVTNPPIDPIRESLVMSLVSMIGPRPNLLGRHAGTHKRLEVSQPILSNEDLEKIRSIHDRLDGAFRTSTLDSTWPRGGDVQSLEAALQRLCWEATEAVLADVNVLILSDRAASAGRIPIPAALATGAVHHHLIRQGLRMQTGLVVETGEAREVHHMCVLAGYGAEAINPWLAFDTIEALAPGSPAATDNYVKALGKGILKVMSKMGISTFQSYCGAQIFDAIGLSEALVDRYFSGTRTAIGGIGLAELAEETVRRHRFAYSTGSNRLDVGGQWALRVGGEAHAWTHDSIANLQHSVRGSLPAKYRAFASEINEQDRRLLTIRGLLDFASGQTPVPIDEVEPAASIVRRFSTGAMSFGSISREAHTTLAVAMNRIGGRSNTGEGGEESDRFEPLEGGDSMRSAIKQVASGRFGVTAEYLVNADELQIKIAQGAKPGEGGQLPGHKVDASIAAVRHSTPGVGLISPPPHHDIYSIEDLAQLIHDLRHANPAARISVKLVAEMGVGTVAAGVAKCTADHITISGFEGGTGASPLTSLVHAGLPWEIGLAEAQQTLVLNGLRGRVTLQADGGLRTGRDVAIAALLGADEFGFATAPLIAAGCIMMRKCHLNTCPVGIATQDPVLRARFTGQPEHVINYFFHVADELREIMAGLGLRSLEEMTGRTDLLAPRPAAEHWKAKGVSLNRLLHQPIASGPRRSTGPCRPPLEAAIDQTLVEGIGTDSPLLVEQAVTNVDRSVGALVSGEIARRFGHSGLPDGRLHALLTGTAGQSFGAFLARGVTLELVGDANDYVGKGLSGGRIIVRPPKSAGRDAAANIVVGNTCLYGAIAGEAFFAGVAGERFAVRNSGALAVVEGTGDHGCEYMTGGIVVVLGEVGRNFAAGMSGGIAFVWDPAGELEPLCNGAGVTLEAVEDSDALRQLVERHFEATASRRAEALLDEWSKSLAQFVQVMPDEYRRALAELETAKVEAA